VSALAWVKALGIWGLFAVAAPINGGLRDFVVAPLLGQSVALPLSGVLLAAIIGLITCLLLPRIGQISAADAWRIGGVWLVLTLGFEFGLGMLLMGKAFADMLSVFDLSGGNLYVLVLLTVFVAPWLTAKRQRGPSAPMHTAST